MDKLVETTQPSNGVVPWSEIEVVGIPQHAFYADFQQLLWSEGFDGPLSSYRKESRGGQRAVSGFNPSQSRLGTIVFFQNLEMKSHLFFKNVIRVRDSCPWIIKDSQILIQNTGHATRKPVTSFPK